MMGVGLKALWPTTPSSNFATGACWRRCMVSSRPIACWCRPCPAKWKCFKYRTFVVRSTDRGRTWDYLATVAYDPGVGLESFCEADLLHAAGRRNPVLHAHRRQRRQVHPALPEPLKR